MLITAMRPIWRDSASVQFGLDPARAVVVEGVGEQSVRLLLGLDGARSEREVLAAAASARLDVPTVAALLDDLRDAGVLTDARPPRPRTSHPPTPDVPAAPPPGTGTTDGETAGGAGAAERPVRRGRGRRARAGRVPSSAGRLAPDRASLALLAGGRDEANTPDELLAARQAAAVVVHGAGRVGATLAALLGAAGVGHVQVVDRGPVRLADLAPGGVVAADLHRSRATAAADAVRRAAPDAQTSQLAAHRLPSVVVIATTRPVDTDLAAALHGAGLPHLVVGVRETTAVVGPLVLPGRTTCLRCTDLHRADRDPAWPLLAAQLTTLRPTAAEPCDVALATLAAALGCLQCLAYLDGEAVTCRDGTLELALPGWQVRRRSWPPHPRCNCGAARRASAGEPAQGEWSP
jgi:hypothetical protein